MSPSHQRVAGHPRRNRLTSHPGFRNSSAAARSPHDRRLVERFDVRLRGDWSQMLTTLIALGALLFTGVSVIQTGRQNAEQNNLTLQGQITDGYTAAVNQIGASILDERLGGIYALERIMHDSPADQPMIVEVLSAFVRDHPPGATTPIPTGWIAGTPAAQLIGSVHLPTDIGAALNVLGRRNVAHDGASIEDLRRVNFAEVDLSFLSLAGVDLSEARLTGARLTNVDLRGANLSDADLTNAGLTNANLNDADLTDASLNNAYMSFATLIGTNLVEAHMINAQLGHARLTSANFDLTDLTCADLVGQDLTNADLSSTHLTCADLSGANLTGARLPDSGLVNSRVTGAYLTNTSMCAGPVPSKPNLGYRCVGP